MRCFSLDPRRLDRSQFGELLSRRRSCRPASRIGSLATLIKRVYEIDPLACPNCGGTMKVVAFLEPPQADVIEKILRHCGLWHATRAPPAGGDFVHAPRGHSQADFDEPRELVFVAEDGIWAEAFPHDPDDDWFRQQPDDGPRELTYVDEDTFWSEF